MRMITSGLFLSGLFLSGLFLSGLFLASSAFAAGDGAKGKQVYDKFCVACHGSAGAGDGAASAALNPKPRDFSNKAEMDKLTDAYLLDVITKGGAALGKSAAMAPWGAQVKGDDLTNIVAYIRSLEK